MYSSNFINNLYFNLSILMSMFTIIIHLVCSIGIAKDISRISENGEEIKIIPGYIWILVGLTTGIWGLSIYWLMHHSFMTKKK